MIVAPGRSEGDRPGAPSGKILPAPLAGLACVTDTRGMTPQQIRRHQTLTNRLAAAETSYVLARAARQDKGQRIENNREALARQRRDAHRDTLREFESAHGKPEEA